MNRAISRHHWAGRGRWRLTWRLSAVPRRVARTSDGRPGGRNSSTRRRLSADVLGQAQLVPSFEQATDAVEVTRCCRRLIRKPRERPSAARVGIGRVYFYFLRGEGTIVAVDKSECRNKRWARGDEPDVLLNDGPVVRQCRCRDATGRLQASDFRQLAGLQRPSSKELNASSSRRCNQRSSRMPGSKPQDSFRRLRRGDDDEPAI